MRRAALALLWLVVLTAPARAQPLFESNFGGSSPLYGFSSNWDGDLGLYFSFTQFLDTGPGGRDFLRSTNLVVGTGDQFYAGWKANVTPPSSGQARFIRVRLRFGSGFNITGNGDNWSDKWIMVGDQDGPEGDRVIAQILSSSTTTPILRVTRNIGSVPDEGAGSATITLGVWHSIQIEMLCSSTDVTADGRIRLYVDNDVVGSPTHASSAMALPCAAWATVGLGFFHNATTASGGDVQMDYAQFEYDDGFDATYHATLNTGGGGTDPIIRRIRPLRVRASAADWPLVWAVAAAACRLLAVRRRG